MVESNAAGNFIVDIIRWLGSAIDFVAFSLLELVYRLFFEVSTAEIISSSVIAEFYSRIQLIIGVFMLFQLAMMILKGIMNPDSFTDSKSGIGNVITRIITALLILTLLVPINISNVQNEYEEQISANGILFGTLYSLQHRILRDNTISKLIFGTERAGTATNDTKTAARTFSTTIVKGFYRINLKEGVTSSTGKEAYEITSNRMCPNYDYSKYLKTDVGAGDIIRMINETCAGHNYAFAYTPVLSLIVGAVFAGLFLSFTIDIVVRTAKLAMLRLIAPIPVISYMNPNGSKDGSFNTWVKTLTSTYLDLFTRLATVYFVLYLIEAILTDTPFNTSDSKVGFIAQIVVFIGLLVFAKQAPKFFKQVLGIKDDGGRGFFSGMGEILAAGSIATSTVGSFEANRRAERDAQEFKRPGSSAEFGNKGKQFVSGVFGAVGGVRTGTAAAFNAKDHPERAAREAMIKRNATTREFGRMGGSTFGAIGSEVQQTFIGESAYDKLDSEFKMREQKVKDAELILKREQDNNAHRKSIMDRAKSKAVDSTETIGTYNGVTGNYRSFHSVYEAAINNGIGVQTQYVDLSGNAITKAQYDSLTATEQANYHEESWFNFDGQRIDMAKANDIDLGLLDENTANYYEQTVAFEQTGTGINDNSILADRKTYYDATGSTLEAKYGALKGKFGEESSKNKAESDKLNRERADINEKRQGYRAQRAQANSRRFRNGGK